MEFGEYPDGGDDPLAHQWDWGVHIKSILEASRRQVVRWNRRANLLSFKDRLRRCVRSRKTRLSNNRSS